MNSPFATATQRKGPGARVVGRPRATAALGWAFVGLIAIGLVAIGSAGALLFGIPMLLVFLIGVATLVRSRVWVDGPVLYHRNVWGMRPPVRLDRLRRAELSAFGRNSGRQLHLLDADGTDLTIDATNLRLARLYEALAGFIPPDSEVADPLLRKRMRYAGSKFSGSAGS